MSGLLLLLLLLLLLHGRSLSRRLRHVRNGAGAVMSGGAGSRGRAKGKGLARSGADGALSTRAKLFGPIETLLVCS